MGATQSVPQGRDPAQECLDKHAGYTINPGELYCAAVYDSYLCWPPTPAGENVTLGCPPMRLSDTTRSAYRQCSDDGQWEGKRPNETSATGWTNYTPCFPAEVKALLGQVYDDTTNEADAQAKFGIAQGTRYLEIAGFSISLFALIISLIIFSYYRSLRNNRTRIHKSLFFAMVVQVLIRLTLYIDQARIRSSLENISTSDRVMGIDNMPYLCESMYTLLEYAITAMFMWMFIEGLYLHNVVTGNALRDRTSHLVHNTTGWGLPVIITGAWAMASAKHYMKENVRKCWYGYNFSALYWIAQAPRLVVILINLVFLLNIMRVLIVKLRRSENSEVEKVRKAVRAALVLLPLLGITNILNMTEAPLGGPVWKFAVWSYSTHFLRSFQGLFIALIYCFCNEEVRFIIRKHYENYMAMRTEARRHRDSVLAFHLSTSGERRPGSTPLRNSAELLQHETSFITRVLQDDPRIGIVIHAEVENSPEVSGQPSNDIGVCSLSPPSISSSIDANLSDYLRRQQALEIAKLYDNIPDEIIDMQRMYYDTDESTRPIENTNDAG